MVDPKIRTLTVGPDDSPAAPALDRVRGVTRGTVVEGDDDASGAEPETLHGFTLPQMAQLYRETADALREQCDLSGRRLLEAMRERDRAEQLRADLATALAALQVVASPGASDGGTRAGARPGRRARRAAQLRTRSGRAPVARPSGMTHPPVRGVLNLEKQMRTIAYTDLADFLDAVADDHGVEKANAYRLLASWARDRAAGGDGSAYVEPPTRPVPTKSRIRGS